MANDPQIAPAARSRSVDADVVAALAERILGQRDHLYRTVSTATRTRSDRMLHVMAANITPDRSLDELLEAARVSPAAAAGLARPRPGWWRALATAIGFQNQRDNDLTDALHLFRVSRHVSPGARWRRQETLFYLQLLLEQGHVDELASELDVVQELDEGDRAFLEIDLAAVREGVGGAAWQRGLDAVLDRHGIRPVRLVGEGATPFDRLAAPGPAGTQDGPLISVAMSSFQPGPEIFSAVRSILDQTWGNLELLVVDDASGEEFAPVLHEVAELDPRVRVLVQPVNRGTYAARNRALSEVRGEIIAFQDSDDWSHPERLARQAQILLDDKSVHSTLSRSIRSTENLWFQHRGVPTTRWNASSLMFRRSVLETIGGFDPVRKGADGEIIERLRSALPGAQHELAEHLAFVRLSTGSLSRGDFLPGWHHPSRVEFRGSYRAWHKEVRAGASALVSPDPADRRYPAPRRFTARTGVPDDTPVLDVVVAGDLREDSDSVGVTRDRALSLVRHGLTVGVLSVEAAARIDASTDPTISAEIRSLITDGVVTHVLPGEDARVDLVLIDSPAAFQWIAPTPFALTAGGVAILAGRTPSDPADGGPWAVADVTSSVSDVFGAAPVWVPSDPTVRAALQDVPGTVLHDHDGVVPVLADWSRPTGLRSPSGLPVIGFASFDGAESWPQTPEDFLAAYPDSDEVDVRLLGALDTAWQVVGRPPTRWMIYRRGDLTTRDLIHQLDYLVWFPAADVTHPPATVLHAIAAGCVAIVPERFRETFGDAAVCTTPGQVLQAVRAFEDDPASRARQVAAGTRYLATQHDPETFVSLVVDLLEKARTQS